ncbi:ABC transporter ATP-binding protein [Devosia sp. FJ2-5-3]|uniref:ABC transporter ATP-binding protein n=1 Tax=Devosia sp. FJ2-5-3 TaxID=2976680 RepID=UPI0023D83B7A|nr:ABC transporter ATP-binding protein [Devosia sp. FJ2-5-3]WEJ59255.1 ABC transporter ATP-binding protein [Devosia sp. FJ2-5-3]
MTNEPGPSVAVSVRDVDMVFDGTHAVKGASFDLTEGRFLTILGPSGSGKTTLLRMIAGFQRPSAGEIYINGTPVSAAPPHKRSIGMVFQKLALFPHMSAAENVAFPLKMRRFDATTIPARVKRYLDLVQLGPYADRRIHQLSGGQQQRVAIARALVFEPDLLLLDEPLAALDRKLREEMQLEFRRIQRELGVTTINVTHDQREALVVSDDVIVMDKGVIQQKAAPADTYRTPANAFVAGFIGVTNFLSGRVSAINGDVVEFEAAGEALAGTWSAPGAPAIGGNVTGALRAEQIRLGATAAELAHCQSVRDGVVRDAIFEGERIVYEIALASSPQTIVRVFDHDPTTHKQFAIGETMAMGWNARDVLIFPN